MPPTCQPAHPDSHELSCAQTLRLLRLRLRLGFIAFALRLGLRLGLRLCDSRCVCIAFGRDG